VGVGGMIFLAEWYLLQYYLPYVGGLFPEGQRYLESSELRTRFDVFIKVELVGDVV
jgi:hypothetical protein